MIHDRRGHPGLLCPFPRPKIRRRFRRPAGTPCLLVLEPLECRQLLSAVTALTSSLLTDPLQSVQATLQLHPTYQQYIPAGSLLPQDSAGPQGYDPAQITAAYGINQISFSGVTGTGAGETIAIIDAYNDPTIKTDLANFDSAFGLAAPPTFSVVSQSGSTKLPAVDPAGAGNDNWEGEEALDVEWAHAIAPGASIILVEANNDSPNNLFAAVKWAASDAGVSVVSMSFGGDETTSDKSFDADFVTPAGHQGVTFVASTGDSAVPAGYPAFSPDVVAAGGTSLSATSQGGYISESGWQDSGGGISEFENQPSYQNGVVTQSTTSRTAPDISWDANPNTGVAVYDSYNNGTNDPWEILGGTSVAAPSLSAMFAIADQGREIAGEGTLDSRSQTLPMLYAAPSTDFHDITSGNNGFAAGAGYDLVTGIGSPRANLLVPYLVTGSNTIQTGGGPSILALIATANGNPDATTITAGTPLTLTANGATDPGATGVTVTFLEESNGIAGLQTGAGGDTIIGTATDSSDSLTISTTGLLTNHTYTFYAQVTDAQGGATATGLDAPSVSVTVVTQSITGPSVTSFSADPNPVVSGDILTLTATASDAGNAHVRRVYFYEETNGVVGLQTGFGGDFSFGPTTSVDGDYSIELDTTGVTGQITFYAVAVDTSGSISSVGVAAPAVTINIEAANPPNSPTGLAAHSISPTEIDLSFNEEDTVQNGFTIQRALNPAFTSFTTLFTINRPDEFTYDDTDLPGNTTFYYRVQAFDLAGNSGFSNTAHATTQVGATHLVFQNQPASITAGDTLPEALTVLVENSHNQVMTTSDATVTIQLDTFPGGATLGGVTSVLAVNGEATFSGLFLTQSGHYTLEVKSQGLKAGVSHAFTVSSDAAQAHLIIDQQPPAVLAGKTIAKPLIVERIDEFGNLVPESGKIHLTLADGPTVGSFTGTTTLAANTGKAVFSTLKIIGAGEYDFNVTDDALPNASPITYTQEVDPGVTAIKKPVVPKLFYTAGSTITITADLSSTAPASLPFSEVATLVDTDGDTLATSTVNKTGVATFKFTIPVADTYFFDITYPGDANHTATISAQSFVLIIAAG